MKLIVLGSGTCVPSLKRNAPGYYIEADGLQALVDCGSGTLRQLERTGRSYKDIDAVFITHRHPDHFTDLMPLIQALIATPDFKRDKTLSIIGPGEVISYYNEAVATVMGTYVNFPIKLIEITDSLDFGPYRVSAARTVHAGDSLAYRFDYRGRALVFTGDADYDQNIVALSQGADMLVADCSFPDARKVRGHLSAKECGLVAQKAGVKKLLLSHLYEVDLPEEDRVTESREEFNGDVILAEDLMEFDI